MMERHLNLRGLSRDEAEAAIRNLVADVQQECMDNLEIDLLDSGVAAADVADVLARERNANISRVAEIMAQLQSAIDGRRNDTGTTTLN